MKSLLRRSAIILSLLTLVVYLGLILHDLYQSHSVLQQSVSMRLLDDTDRRGSAIGYFFSERLNDLSDLQESRSLSAYYENLALGMSMEYGLAASLEDVNATFRKFSNKKALGGKSIYKRLVFLEADGRKLVDSMSANANENKGEERMWREFLYPKDARHQFSVSGQEAEASIVISVPYIFRGEYKGSILTWLSLQEIFHYFLAGFSGKDTPIFFINKNRHILPMPWDSNRMVPAEFLENVRSLYNGDVITLPISGSSGVSQEFSAFRSSIPLTPFSLVTLLPVGKTDKSSPARLVAVSAAIGVLILIGSFMMIRSSMRNTVLNARLEEVQRHKQEIERQNLLLQKAETSLAEERQRLANILEGTNVGTWEWNVQTGETVVNEHWAGMTGYALAELVPVSIETWQKLAHPDDLALSGRLLARHFRKELPYYECEVRARHKNGQWVWFLDRGKVMTWTEDGKPLSMFGTHQDITARKEAEEALRESEGRLRNIMESVQAGIMIIDPETHTVVDVNQNAAEMIGVGKEEIIGRVCHTYVCPAEKGRCPITDLGHKIDNAERTLLRADGTAVPILKSVRSITLGGQKHLLETFIDITDRKQAELEIIKERELAESATKAKSDFLASMSHEIRTPMNAIIGMAELLIDTPLTEEQQQYVNNFRSAGENLLVLINDILDLSKVESGGMSLECSPFDLHDLIERVSDVLAVRAHKKGLELGVLVADDVPPYVYGDPARLRQILINLIGNAVKFTEKGDIFVKVTLGATELQALPGNSIPLVFSIRDTGIGIPADKIDHIFERFTQADSSTTRNYGGTGLGLAISKQLVKLMGGRIWVESKEGEGSNFFFAVEFEVQEQPERLLDHSDMDIQGLRTLIVDDTDTNRLILREMLISWGALVTEADNGHNALNLLTKAVEEKEPFHLVLLDCRMPQMDGFAVMTQMRESGLMEGLSIMMLTSDNRKGDIIKAKELGIQEYLIKPVKKSDVLQAIRSVMGRKQTSRDYPAPAMEPVAVEELPPLKILLVEDTRDNIILLQAYFKKTACEIDIAENGAVAVEKFKETVYDVVLMDVQMPVMDGYTATQKIREWEGENHRKPTPVLALTAHALKDDEQKSLDAGCNAHITKPIKKAALFEAIQRIVS